MFVAVAIRKIRRTMGVSISGPVMTLNSDFLTLKLVYESHLRRGTFLPNLSTLGLSVLEFAMYATDGRMDGQKQRLLPLPFGRHNNAFLF